MLNHKLVMLPFIFLLGNRFGGWLCKLYPGNWEILVKKTSTQASLSAGGYGEFETVYESEKPPDSTFAWKTAKAEYTQRNGGFF